MRRTADIPGEQEPGRSRRERVHVRRRLGFTSLRSASSRAYYALRIYLHKQRWLLRSTQVVRGWWVLGPFRRLAVRYYRTAADAQPSIAKTGIFSQVDVAHIVESVEREGYAEAGQIPANYVAEILSYCEHTKLQKYWNPHRDCAAIDRLARDTTVVEIARQYLGAEPILWLTQLRWSFGTALEQRAILSSLHPEPVQYDSDAFHYDTLDYKSLTVFIYLTDVEPDSGPHVVIKNTHKTKSFYDICHIILSDKLAQKKFGDQITMILGPPGTVFFEETSCFHKAARCRTKRLMLSIDYVLQRMPPPERLRLASA